VSANEFLEAREEIMNDYRAHSLLLVMSEKISKLFRMLPDDMVFRYQAYRAAFLSKWTLLYNVLDDLEDTIERMEDNIFADAQKFAEEMRKNQVGIE